MGKKKEKITDAAHVKRHTQGTSNELSFSVLDAAKTLADIEEGKTEGPHAPGFGKVRIFASPFKGKKPAATPIKENTLPLSQEQQDAVAKSLSGGKGTISSAGKMFNADEEIFRRKKRRRRRRLIAALVTLVGGVALISIASLFLYSEFSGYQDQLSILDQSLEKIAEADEVLVPVDEMVVLPIDELDQKEAQKLLDALPETEKQLASAKVLAEEAQENIRIFSDKEVVDHAISAIEVREVILENGEVLLSAGIQAQKDKDNFEDAWAKMLEADSFSREAAEIVEDTTNENVEASNEKLNEAAALFQASLVLLQEVNASTLDIDVSLFIEYVETRIEATQHAIASNNAILAQERELAESENEAYAELDDKAIALATELPDNREYLVMAAYDQATEKARERYQSARSEAGASDTFLRDYLGT